MTDERPTEAESMEALKSLIGEYIRYFAIVSQIGKIRETDERSLMSAIEDMADSFLPTTKFSIENKNDIRTEVSKIPNPSPPEGKTPKAEPKKREKAAPDRDKLDAETKKIIEEMAKKGIPFADPKNGGKLTN